MLGTRWAGTDAVPRAHGAVSSLQLSILPAARLLPCPADFGRGLQQPFGRWSSDGGEKQHWLRCAQGETGGSVDLQEEGKPPGTFCLGKDLLIVPRIVVPQLIF